MEKALEVYENRNRRVTTSVLNETMLREIERYPAPMTRGYSVKIKFVQQAQSMPVTFRLPPSPDALSVCRL